MDKSYYFVLETDGVDDGPYRLPEIQRRVEIGLISRTASLCKVGETTYVPLTDARYSELLEPPKRAASGTTPPPVVEQKIVDPYRATVAIEPPAPKVAPPAVAAMPPGFVPPVPAATMSSLPPPMPFAAATPVPPMPVAAPVPPPLPINAQPPFVAHPVPSIAQPAPFAAQHASANGQAPASFGQASFGAQPPQTFVAHPAPPAHPTPIVASAPMTAASVPTAAPNAQTYAPHLMMPAVNPIATAPLPNPMPAATNPLNPIVTAPLPHPTAAATASLNPIATAPLPSPMPAATAPLPSLPAAQKAMAAARKSAAPKSMPPAPAMPSPLVSATTPILPPPPIPMPQVAVAIPELQPVAEGSAPAQMPMPDPQPMAMQLYNSEPQHSRSQYEPQPYDSNYQPPIYEQPVYDQPDMTAQTPRLESGDAWWKSKRVWAIAGGSVTLLVIIAVAATRGGGAASGTAKDAMVRVTTSSNTGAGFFIAGPDGYAYVATANHVVDRGERILVERDVGEDKHSFVEAYPETEIVAADPDADLAIIRIKNVDASRFPMLSLAEKPTKDEKILSYGYPGSSLATKTGLVSKDGKVLSLVSFPAYDERYQRVLRDNAVDGLLISTDIEPGMSGGPTTNDAGEVVGVNVTKDRAHVGQNGAVSVIALRALLAKVKPAAEKPQPTTDDVVKMLDRIQSDYLLLPLDERKKVRETEFVNAGDLPALRQLVGEVRREERNTDTSFIAKYRLSGQAALGIFFARMPGKLLETYRAPSTTGPLNACELANRRLTSFLGDLSTADKRVEPPKSKLPSCDELAVRPLAWDLVAATLQWEGKEQRYTVTKLDKLDEDGKLYRASVRIAGTSNLIELFLGVDQGRVRLKLFDPTNSLYAIKSPRNVPNSALQGTWSMKRPRVTDAINKNAEIESTETVSLSINDGKVSIRYVVSEQYFGAGNRAQVFKCNGKRTIETGLLQSFSGTLENGVVVALPDKEAEPLGPDAAYCISSHRADRIIAAKLAGDQLLVYRTDGNAYPEAIQLTRDNGAVVPAPAKP